MRVPFQLALSAAIVVGGSSFTHAGWSEFWSRSKTDAHRNNYWPGPFNVADRAAVREPFAIMVNNGWRMQNTLGDAYFDPSTQELTVAGQIKAKWIVTQSPAARRTVFVLGGETEDVTQVRVASVQRAVGRFATPGTIPDVLLTDREPTAASGEYYEAVDRALKDSVQVPRLPKGASAGGASSGAGNGGSGGGAAP